jgi:hypothetical protein
MNSIYSNVKMSQRISVYATMYWALSTEPVANLKWEEEIKKYSFIQQIKAANYCDYNSLRLNAYSVFSIQKISLIEKINKLCQLVVGIYSQSLIFVLSTIWVIMSTHYIRVRITWKVNPNSPNLLQHRCVERTYSY